VKPSTKHITCRGTPFWGQHAACKMLMKDVEDGIDKMKIWKLWESREEYKAFPYDFFCKHVYEESALQRCSIA
jgi:hypothetical protein